MKISELVKQLQLLSEKHGDVEVKVQSLTHLWPPEPAKRPFTGPVEYILLNP